MLAVRRALRLCQRVANVSVSRRGCAGAVPLDDIVNGLTEEQIQVSTHLLTKPGAKAREMSPFLVSLVQVSQGRAS